MSMEQQPDDHLFDPRPISEGMAYGPFPLPEAAENAKTADWLWREAGGDSSVYELLCLRESLIDDRNAERIDDELFERNLKRLLLAKHNVINRRGVERVKNENPPIARGMRRKR